MPPTSNTPLSYGAAFASPFTGVQSASTHPILSSSFHQVRYTFLQFYPLCPARLLMIEVTNLPYVKWSVNYKHPMFVVVWIFANQWTKQLQEQLHCLYVFTRINSITAWLFLKFQLNVYFFFTKEPWSVLLGANGQVSWNELAVRAFVVLHRKIRPRGCSYENKQE